MTTLAAVGSAMQQARDRVVRPGAPTWRQFEMPAIFRSYFDPLIVAAVLRWVEPHEAWWGTTEVECSGSVLELLNKITEDDRKIVLPELLLAAAQGKVPRSAHEELLELAREILDRPDATRWPAENLAPVRVGWFLLDAARRPVGLEGPWFDLEVLAQRWGVAIDDLQRHVDDGRLRSHVRNDRMQVHEVSAAEFEDMATQVGWLVRVALGMV